MSEHTYLAWEFGLSNRADLAWVLVDHIKRIAGKGRARISDLIEAHGVRIGTVTTVHFLINAQTSSPRLRNHLIVQGEHVIDDMFARHPWLGSALIEGLQENDVGWRRKEVYSSCEQTTVKNWLNGMPQLARVDSAVLKFASAFTRHIAPDLQALKTALPVVVAHCCTSKEQEGMVARLYSTSQDTLLAEELTRSAERLHSVGSVPMDPEVLGADSQRLFLALSEYLRGVHGQGEELDSLDALRVFGNLVGLRVMEVDYLVQLGIAHITSQQEAWHV